VPPHHLYVEEDNAMTTTTNESHNPSDESAVPYVLLPHLREMLEDQHRLLLQRAEEFVDDIEVLRTPTATRGQGESEHANSEVELGMTVGLAANTLTLLEDVAFALARMDDGTFGVCATCSAPVGVERLMAVPQTRYCVACQQRHEKGR
jgi:DnaK suppressor protein